MKNRSEGSRSGERARQRMTKTHTESCTNGRPPLEKYSLIVFDADNTLFDFEVSEALALERLFRNHGLDYTEETRNFYREENTVLWSRFEQGLVSKANLQIQRFQSLFDRLNLRGLDPAAFNDEYVLLLGENPRLIDGALMVCRELSKTKTLAIATNGVEKTQRLRFERSEIKPFVKHLVISEAIGFAKPDVRYFDYLFTLCGHKEKADVLIVGDSLLADIQGGNAYGIDTCWYNPWEEINTSGIIPNYEIRSLEQLIFP